MKFGARKVTEALNCILAHGLRSGAVRFKKGRKLDQSDLDTLAAAGVEDVIVVELEKDDVEENDAALDVAKWLSGAGVSLGSPRVGRVNLFAARDGLLVIDEAQINAANRQCEQITIATHVPFEPVLAGQLVATAKTVSFAIRQDALNALEAVIDADPAAIRVLPPALGEVALLQTTAESLRPEVMDKTESVTRDRVERLGGTLVHTARVPHEADRSSRHGDAHRRGEDSPRSDRPEATAGEGR